ncbi:FadR family transcriptional regulator [Glaciimonas sp. PCH181]|nr:FadR family transcriptional regulator [Glaciimonas sp. PCH181]
MPSYRSRSEMLADTLISKIKKGELQVGDKLPSEQEIARYYGVSRTVVREAVARLKSSGMVESTQGRGAFVIQSRPLQRSDTALLMPRSARGLVDFLEVRRGIESEMAALAAARRTDAQCAQIESALAAIDQANLAGRNGVEEDMAFHLAIGAATGNLYWSSFVSFFSEAMQSGIRVTRANEARRKHFAEAVACEHRQIFAAIQAGDPASARAAADMHLVNAAARIYGADEAFWQQEGQILTDNWEKTAASARSPKNESC